MGGLVFFGCFFPLTLFFLKKVLDLQTQQFVALKVIKNKPQFYKQGLIEVKLLAHMRQSSLASDFVVDYDSQFLYRNHLCVVFELLGQSLYDVLHQTRFDGVPVDLVRTFAVQLVRALLFLKHRDVNIVHCDLKPENILLKDPNRSHSEVKLIDFGSSCHHGEQIYKYIQSRFYRAPEVILGLPYSHPIDIWSLGCILSEMHCGSPLFAGKDEMEQLAVICAMKGPVSDEMMESSPHARKYFLMEESYSDTGGLSLVWKTKGVDRVPKCDLMAIHVDKHRIRNPTAPPSAADPVAELVNLIHAMTRLDPSERITPEEALEHPFLRGVK
jgi:dual specificity tyrosine-phosphorylation-regulated kinase 1